jgi:hypothetical protein
MILAFIARQENHGMTDVIRLFDLTPTQYDNLAHFFKSQSWNLKTISDKWTELVFKSPHLERVSGLAVLIMDGVKQAKEGRKMPGGKKHHQESENSGKAEYIHGHLFGGLGVLLGNFCTPLSLRLHDGVDSILEWMGEEDRRASHVVLMIRQSYEALIASGEAAAIALGDRYFLSVPALQELTGLQEKYGKKLHFVSKAKKSAVAYHEPPERKKGQRGRPRLKGEKVKFKELFESHSTAFRSERIEIYGELREIRYLSRDLLWGQKHYKKLRFVLVEYENRQEILVTTDLAMAPQTVIKLYSRRFRIECTFKELKQDIGGFDYHFWSGSMTKLDYFKRKNTPDPLKEINDKEAQEKIIKAFRATEMFTMCAGIALGLLQMKSLDLESVSDIKSLRYQRTYRTKHASLPATKEYLRRELFLGMGKPTLKFITEIIKSRRTEKT